MSTVNEDQDTGPRPREPRPYGLRADAGTPGDGAGAVRVLHLTGSVDWNHSSALLVDLVRARGDTRVPVVVDLGGLTFADSPLLHVLLDFQRACRARGLPFRLSARMHPVVERLFTVTGTLGFFELTAPLPDTDVGERGGGVTR